MYVADQLLQIRIFLTVNGFIAALKQMSEALVSNVEALGVAGE